ncbi:glycosyltransferase family 9 protein [Methanocaldococcus indicus]|uniref:glycosyltransferase family 9 protein n=1 Tax=Methanocaldococcus indicus TaxID=213231 RepID=UPI003C6D3259
MFKVDKIKQKFIAGWVINNKYYYRVVNKYLALFLYFLDIFLNPLFKKRKFPKKIENILIIRVEQIGDVILTTSFFRELKRNYPNAKLTVLCRKLTKDLFKLIPWIDNIIILNTPWLSRNDSEGFWNVLKFIKENYKKYDLVFDLHPDPRNLLIARFVGKYTIAYGIRGFRFLIDREISWNFKKVEHIVDRYLNILEKMGLNIEEKELELKLDEKIMMNIKKKLKNTFNLDIDKEKNIKIVLIHPISGREEKNISWKEWEIIIKNLLKEKDSLIFIGGAKNEKSIINKNLGHLIDNKRVFNIAGLFSLLEYIHFIDLVDIIYSVDTFVVHVASALKKKIKTFYVATNENEWGYYGKD